MEGNDIVLKVHRWLVFQAGKPSCSLSAIEKKFSDEVDLEPKIKSNNDLFWIAETSPGKVDVKPKLNIRLCLPYVSKEFACNGQCGKMHLCPKNLLSSKFCKSPCKNDLSHSIKTNHNNKVLNDAIRPLRMQFNNSNQHTLHSLVRSSFPRLCKMFTDTGKCDKVFCGYLHVCFDYLNGDCKGKTCKLAAMSRQPKSIVHNLQHAHNRKLLKNFGFEPGNYENKELLCNILLPDNGSDDFDNESISSSLSDVSSISLRDDTYDPFSLRDETQLFQDNNQRSVHLWLSKNKFFKADLNYLSSQFPRVNNLLAELQSNPSMFWISQTSTDDYEIRPKVNVKFCISHANGESCDGLCNQLHLCKQFLFSSSSCKQYNCPYGHDISLSHNQNVLRSVFPNNYDETVKLKILRASFPRLCKDLTNKGNCDKPFCGNFHLCKENVQGNCQRGENCHLASVSGQSKGVLHSVQTEHNKMVANMFQFGTFNKSELLASILIEERSGVNALSKNNPIMEATSYTTFPNPTFILPYPVVQPAQFKPVNPKPLMAVARSVPNLSTINQNYGVQNHPDKLDIELCGEYLNGRCKNKYCSCLHICKEFVISANRCVGNCVFGFSHYLLNDHNKQIINRCHPTVPSEKIMNIVRNSFPRICLQHQKGKCTESSSCNKVHVCKTYLSDEICLDENCGQCHNFSSERNKQIFKQFPLIFKMLDEIEKLKINILFSQVLPKDAKESSNKNNEKVDLETVLSLYKDILGASGYIDLGSEIPDFISPDSNAKPILSYFRIVQMDSDQCLLYTCPAELKVCPYYWRNPTGCKPKLCKMLHICKWLIYNKNGCTSKQCKLNHDFKSKREREIVKSSHMEDLNEKELKLLLKNRYPFVCKKYLANQCTSSDTCPNVHVCDQFLQGKCKKEDCQFNHEEGLTNEHAKKLMKEYHISKGLFRNTVILPKPERLHNREKKKKVNKVLLSIIDDDGVEDIDDDDEDDVVATDKLISFDDENPRDECSDNLVLPSDDVKNCSSSTDGNRQCNKTIVGGLPALYHPVNSNDLYDNNEKSFCATFAPEKNDMIKKELYSENKETKYEQDIPEQTNVDEKHEVAKEKPPVVKPRISFDSGTKLTDTTWEPPSEIDVFKLIIQPPFNGSCSTGNRNLLRKFFRNRKALGMTWFRDHSHTFRLDDDKVYLCVENILPCYDYWSTECKGFECDRFHICKQYLHNLKHSEISCKFSHNFNTPHNQSVIKKLTLEPLSFQQLIILLKYRFPLVCKRYVSGDCTNGSDECSDVHICGDFVNGTCTKPHGLCSFQHYDGLTDKNAERFKRNYHIADDDEVFRKCIIYFKEQPAKASAKVFTTENNFNSLKDEAICHRFLNDICEEEDDCKLLHPKSMLPYAWQYKKKDGIWKMLPPKLKVELEKCYCDPANVKFDSLIVDKSLPDLHTILDNESSSPITARYMNETVEIRRLSTKSKAIATSSENILDYLTEWKWYWKGTKWEEYNPVKNEDIEKAFLRGDAFFHFSIDEYNYRLSFDVMEQQNLGPKYFTKRKVSRRPFFDNAALSSGNDVQNIEDNKPWYWPKDVCLEGGRLDVEETNKQAIIRKFESSISAPVRVIDVAEICNIEFHQKYQSKKRQFTKKLGAANVKELTLYHGTDAAVVDGICVHNFDWRLSGKNATAFGQGSYFAKEASYSHQYTIPDPNTRFRYMFVANILAGKYTVGNSSMKRPPPISISDSNVLYDSCVNHQTSPNIFVVFERDQCYPQYLITYVGEGERYFAPNFAMAHKVQKLKPLSTPPKRPAPRPPPVSKVSNQPTSVSPGVSSSTGSALYSSYGHTTYQPTSLHNSSNTGSSSYSGHKQAKYQPTSSRNSKNTKDKSKCVIS